MAITSSSLALSDPASADPGAASEARDADAPVISGEFLRLIAARLTAAGLAVAPAPDEDDESIAVGPVGPARRHRGSRDALYLLAADSAGAHLHCYPRARKSADPHWLADIAAALLSGTAGSGPRHPDAVGPAARRLIGLKGIVGMDLRHRGFSVTLHTYPDDYYYGVSAEISATGPGDDGGGTVWIADDGTLYWEYDFRHQPPGRAAEAIAQTVTAAIRTAWPRPGDSDGTIDAARERA